MASVDSADTYDFLLQASRRVDWRFLLPEPNLGRVACLTADEELAAACSRFASTSTLLGTPADGGREAFDVVVLTSPSSTALRAAVALVRPGGWIYVELRSLLSRHGRRAGGPRFPRGCAAALERLGLVEVEAHWHWPDFASAVEIVPLRDAGAMQNMLLRRSATAPLKAAAGRFLLSSGLIRILAPCASVIGRVPGSSEAQR